MTDVRCGWVKGILRNVPRDLKGMAVVSCYPPPFPNVLIMVNRPYESSAWSRELAGPTLCGVP